MYDAYATKITSYMYDAYTTKITTKTATESFSPKQEYTN